MAFHTQSHDLPSPVSLGNHLGIFQVHLIIFLILLVTKYIRNYLEVKIGISVLVFTFIIFFSHCYQYTIWF